MSPYKQTALAVLPDNEFAEVILDSSGYVAGRWRNSGAWSDFHLITGPGNTDVSIAGAGPGRALVSVLSGRDIQPGELPIGGRTVYEFTPSGSQIIDSL